MVFGNSERRDEPRYDVLECVMLWKPTESIPERIGPAVITNASIGGVQLRTKPLNGAGGDLLLQLGSEEGTIYIPGSIAYSVPQPESGLVTVGFNFSPQSGTDRDAIAKYMLGLRDRVCTDCA